MEEQEPNYKVLLISVVIVGTAGMMCLFCLLSPVILGHHPRNDHHLGSINHLKNLALAVHNFERARGEQLPHTGNAQGVPMSWRTQLLPYLDQTDVYLEYDCALAWNEGENAKISRKWITVFASREGGRHRSAPKNWARADYGMVSGPGTVQPDEGVVSLDEISNGDGLAQTLLIVECAGLNLAWAEPRDPRVDREEMRIENLTRSGQTSTALISSFNPHGIVVMAFADGVARSLSSKIDPKVLAALCTVNGGEKIAQEDYLR